MEFNAEAALSSFIQGKTHHWQYSTEELRAMMKLCARRDLNKPFMSIARYLKINDGLTWRELRDIFGE